MAKSRNYYYKSTDIRNLNATAETGPVDEKLSSNTKKPGGSASTLRKLSKHEQTKSSSTY